MTPLEIRPLAGAGAQLVGVDLTATTVGEWNQIEAAFASFGLLVFPDQVMTHVDRQRFGERWGALRNTPSTDATTGEPTTLGWIADRSFAPTPLAASLLSANVATAPTVSVASMYAAFDTLSTGTQHALEVLHAEHRHGDASATHPLVIRHPVSGRKVMYLNPAYTSSIVGMDESEGRTLLNELFAHSLLDEFATTIVCEPGTVVLLDHRSFLRFADTPDADSPAPLSTVQIEGPALAPAVKPAKPDPSFTQRAGATLAGGIITAAMTGIADVLEPEKRTHDIEIVSDAPEREPLSGTLDFGDLPSLD